MAHTGTPTIIPQAPQILPKTVTDNNTKRGLIPVDLPKIFGWIRLESICPKTIWINKTHNAVAGLAAITEIKVIMAVAIIGPKKGIRLPIITISPKINAYGILRIRNIISEMEPIITESVKSPVKYE